MTPAELINPNFRDVVENTFKADGSLDPALFVSRLTPDAIFQLGGNPPVNGRDRIRELLVETFRTFQHVEHRLLKAYELADVLVYEAVVTYTFGDGRKLEVPYANILEFDGNLVRRYRVYLDLPQ